MYSACRTISRGNLTIFLNFRPFLLFQSARIRPALHMSNIGSLANQTPQKRTMASTGILSEADDYMETVDGVQISIRRTIVEKESDLRKDAAIDTVSHLSSAPLLSTQVDKYMPHQLANAIFCGHLVTDMDSIAGAIGAAELYGGTPARASEINSETKFCLEHWGVTQPEPIEELLQSNPDAAVCLVDHQQTSQLNPAIDVNRIVGVIDHHALQNATIVTDMPIYIDIRPWGSMSTIIAHTFITMNRRPTKSTAGMLLCAILSDTLNLQGPTTTDWDRMMVAVLVQLANVEDVQALASEQFKAKSSELAGLTAEQLVNGDQKVFTFKTDKFEGSVGFAVVETTDDEVIMSRSAELLMALSEDKEAKGLSVLFLAVVNIVSLKSNLLLCGPVERSLAVAAFKNGKLIPDLSAGMPPSNATSASTSTSTSTSSNNVTVMDLGGLVSRKKDFIPAVTGAVKAGWSI